MVNNLDVKLESLRRRFREFGSAVVAFSGGVDSSVLVKIAHEELGERMVAVTAISPSLPRGDFESARQLCETHRIPHVLIETDEFSDCDFMANGPDRCYHCKKNLYEKLAAVARERGLCVVVEGTNASDLGGHRPGYKASKENEVVRTPLIDCSITKDEVRTMAEGLGLDDASHRPASACLSSRIPTGTPIDPDALKIIDSAEEAIRAFGVKMVRVRHHGDLARIEVGADEIQTVIDNRLAIEKLLGSLGYRYITLDLKGYRANVPSERNPKSEIQNPK